MHVEGGCMSWVAAIGAGAGIAGKVIGGSTASGGSPLSAPAGDFKGGNTGDFNVNKPAITQTTIWVIVGAIVAIFFIWRATAKK